MSEKTAETSAAAPADEFVLMPRHATYGQYLYAQGALLDVEWDAVECFSARYEALVRVAGAPVAVEQVLLYQHEDGRYALARNPQTATFTVNEPKWHRIGHLELPAAPAERSEQILTVPDDFRTHKEAWRSALEIAREHAQVRAPDIDDKAYWDHELRAFDRAHAELQVKNVAFTNLWLALVQWSEAGSCDVDGDFRYRLPDEVRNAIKAAGAGTLVGQVDLEYRNQIVYALERAEVRLRSLANTLLSKMDYTSQYPDEDADRMVEAIELLTGAPAAATTELVPAGSTQDPVPTERAPAPTEEALLLIENSASMLRGMTMDPAIPPHAKDAMRSRITELEAFVEKHV